MVAPASINPQIIESLYGEALLLSDEVRATFVLGAREDAASPGLDKARVALSCEALRTTTRMMHVLAWLLNHRAYFAGELSEFQLRRHGKLTDFPEADPQRMTLLEAPIRQLIEATERFHARLKRLDESWDRNQIGASSALAQLRERLGVSAHF